MTARDLTGVRFGRLVAYERGEPYIYNGTTFPRWKCICDCGGTALVRVSGLTSGTTKSCGCLCQESRRNAGKLSAKHGLRGTSIYKLWSGIKARCLNRNSPAYYNYGGRGISVCEHIAESAKNLHELIGDRPDGRYPSGRPKFTIDRKDNNGGYWCGKCKECVSSNRPLNIRWATVYEQNQNTRANKFITARGRKLCAAEWERITGIDRHHVAKHLIKSGQIQ
jgi:hypothetical protein